MKAIIGTIIIFASVLGGFAAQGGHIISLWQPFEFVILIGAAFGGFLISNPMSVVVQSFKAIPRLFSGKTYSQDDYLDILSFMYELFVKARKEGLMAIESDIEEPEESPLFQKYPKVLENHHAVEFVCDYMRLAVSGSMNPFELDNLMDIEISTHHHEAAAASHAVQRVSDGLPAFGIVAAVLGIVHTMAALDGPLEEIGKLVAAALVGTFTGILGAYAFVGPMAVFMERLADEETRLLSCLRACILANFQGYNPQMAVEFGRKTMTAELRPSFMELEEHLRGGGSSAT